MCTLTRKLQPGFLSHLKDQPESLLALLLFGGGGGGGGFSPPYRRAGGGGRRYHLWSEVF